MILYTLCCEADHRFDSWFPNSSAFDAQSLAGLVLCPSCGSSRIGKTIMAPALVGGRGGDIITPQPEPIPQDSTAQDSTAVSLLDAAYVERREMVKALRDTILAEAQDVGDRFPEQARRMQNGDIAVRQIHGHATPREARELIEDGIMILPLPSLPEELN